MTTTIPATIQTRGTVKWFSDAKGYGFIESAGVEYFAHYSQIDAEGYKSLGDGDKVTFEPVDNGRGPAAHNIRVSRS